MRHITDTARNPSPLLELQERGQSIWLDDISRGLITAGELQGRVERDGVTGR